MKKNKIYLYFLFLGYILVYLIDHSDKFIEGVLNALK